MTSCVICNQQYDGQTVNKVTKTWSSHRDIWNKPDNRDDTDQMALSRNNTMFHGILNRPPFYNSYNVIFIEQRSFNSLNTCEDEWLNKPNAQFSTQSMMLPCVKSFLFTFFCQLTMFVLFHFCHPALSICMIPFVTAHVVL